MTCLFTRCVHSIGASRLPRSRGIVLWSLIALAAVATTPTRVGAAPAEERTPPASESMAAGLFGKSQAYLDMVERYLSLMEKFARITEDPAASGSAAVLSAREILTSDGDTTKAIEYFTQVLPEVKNEAVQRTIHIELSELYKRAGQKDKALEQLRILMISAPTEAEIHREGHTPISDATGAARP